MKNGGRRPGAGRKPNPLTEKKIKVTIEITESEALALADALRISGKTRRYALVAGIAALALANP